jgi:SSS family solute:Na+ symporter
LFLFYITAFITIALFVYMGLKTGSNASASDFSLCGQKSSATGVAGILLGALVGGASTVGTVQMAYKFGLSAIWFTVGGGLGCLILGLRFAAPIRASGITTIADHLENSYSQGGSRYGKRISQVATVSSSAGTFISMSAQLIACAALLRGALPMPLAVAIPLSALFILGFIAIGGLKSFSKLGKAKIVLLYAALMLCAGVAVKNGGTFSRVAAALPDGPWFNPFGRGLVKDLGAIGAMIVGVFSTQIYIQSLVAAKDTVTARNGAFISALLMPPMGLLGTWVGLSVRAQGIEISAEQVLPWFIRHSFPGVVGGVIWSGVFITAVACAAGLVLGISTNISKNLIPKKLAPATEKGQLTLQRGMIIFLVILSVVLSVFGANSMILEWSYVSMGLRGAGIFLPFTVAILRPGKLAPVWAFASAVGGLLGMILSAALGLPFDPLFSGLIISACFVAAGYGR